MGVLYLPALQRFISDEPFPVLRIVLTTVLCLVELFPRFLLGLLMVIALGDMLRCSPPLGCTQFPCLGPKTDIGDIK